MLNTILVSSCSFLRKFEMYWWMLSAHNVSCLRWVSEYCVSWETVLTDSVVMDSMMAWTLMSLIWIRLPLGSRSCVFHTFSGSIRRSRSMTPFLVPVAAPVAMDTCAKANSMAELILYNSMNSMYFGNFAIIRFSWGLEKEIGHAVVFIVWVVGFMEDGRDLIDNIFALAKNVTHGHIYCVHKFGSKRFGTPVPFGFAVRHFDVVLAF